MGLEMDTTENITESLTSSAERDYIPGLDLSDAQRDREKKVPYSKPIPRNFQAHWNDTGKTDESEDASREIKEVITQLSDGPGGQSAQPMETRSNAPTAILVYGRRIPILRK